MAFLNLRKRNGAGLVKARCGVDDCEEQIIGSSGREIERGLAAHRLSCHPGYVKPPPSNALKSLPG